MSIKYVDKIQYLGYSTIYSAKGTINNFLADRACFAEILNRGNIQEEHYEIYLIKTPQYAIERHNSNLCLLNKTELKKHIISARRLFPFTYSIEEVNYKELPAYKISIDLNASHFYHRYLLTWIRYAYEFPFNLILQDALRMKHSYLERVSITNLFVLCANSYYSGPNYNTGHSISVGTSKFLKEAQLRSKIAELAQKENYNVRVNNIYPKINDYQYAKNYPINKSENCRYLDYWMNVEDFEERAKIYLQGYKYLKNLDK